MIPRVLASSLAAMWLSACNGNEPECTEQLACPRVDQVCEAGVCVEKRCANSSQCPMESYCSVGDCLPGCVEEGDCYPGDTCNLETNVCEPEACADTHIDCGFREFCNVATGDCYDAGSQYCKSCDYQEGECGGGNLCLNHYCGVDCSQGQACPSGFECYPFTDDFGNIAAFQCFTYCWLYDDVPPGSDVKTTGGLHPLGPILPPQSPVEQSE